jgi:hypothetical protein
MTHCIYLEKASEQTATHEFVCLWTSLGNLLSLLASQKIISDQSLEYRGTYTYQSRAQKMTFPHSHFSCYKLPICLCSVLIPKSWWFQPHANQHMELHLSIDSTTAPSIPSVCVWVLIEEYIVLNFLLDHYLSQAPTSYANSHFLHLCLPSI